MQQRDFPQTTVQQKANQFGATILRNHLGGRLSSPTSRRKHTQMHFNYPYWCDRSVILYYHMSGLRGITGPFVFARNYIWHVPADCISQPDLEFARIQGMQKGFLGSSRLVFENIYEEH